MRGARNVAMAMRAPDGTIVLHEEPLSGIYLSKIRKIPFVRGLILLWDSLGLGMRLLTISANTQSGEDEKLEGPALYVTLGGSILIAVALFFLAPALLGQLSESLIGLNAWWGNVFEGLVRLGILIGYIWAIGKIPDIQRVFSYHGAEHKTINAYEAGAELKPEVVCGYSLQHPRCGTAFLLTLVLLSILIFSLLGPLPVAIRLLSRILFIPILAGIAYEYIRWTANHLNSSLVKWMIKPNLALQALTTREPTLEMLEVSIAAFKAMRAREAEGAGDPQVA
jgi:uncharacterized protein YqhQ